MAEKIRLRLLLTATMLACLSVAASASRAGGLAVEVRGIGDPALAGTVGRAVGAAPGESADTPRARRYQVFRARQMIVKALAAEGYYDPDIGQSVSGGDSPNAVFTVREGERTTIRAVRVEGREGAQGAVKRTRPGRPLLARDVLADQKDLFEAISRGTCLYGLTVTHTAILEKDGSATVVFHVADKGPARLGKVTFAGLKRVKADHVRKLAALREGACYKAADIERAQQTLLQSGLFSVVRADMPDAPEGGVAPVLFRLTESKPRTVRAGLSYYTDEGPGVTLGWEHRNFFGRGEKLSLDAKLSALLQSLSSSLKKPFFMRRDQTLNLGASLKREDTDAYEATTLSMNGAVERRIDPRLLLGLGGGYDLSHVRDTESGDNFALVYGMGFADWDSRDDALDPHRGFKARLDLKPFVDLFDPGTVFWKTELNAGTYEALAPSIRLDPVIALRGRWGSILGPAANNIPATQRFYAGGGGSVRGFAYQDIGPRDDNGDPLGGRSVAEASAELRFRVTKKIGAAAFVDAGAVSASIVPDGGGFAAGAGLGLRYYTDFGPLRLDVGVPVSHRAEAGGGFQLYMSIGQAF